MISINQMTKGAFFLALFALLGAYIAEYAFGFLPCKLCLFQRYIFCVILGFAGYALVVEQPHKKIVGLWMASLAYLLNAGVAGYQVLVEKKIIDLPAFCKPVVIENEDFESFKQALMLTKNNMPTCDQVSFEFLGVSMAGYNFFFCFIIAGLLMLNLRKRSST